MGKIKRYLTAWSRHHRSRGFGIHSPFAYRFVREVLRQRLPYYSYEHIEALRSNVVKLNGGRWRGTKVVTAHDAKLLFRITNHFNPAHILQVGAGHGITTASMLAVSTASRVWLYEGVDSGEVARRVLEVCGDRVARYSDIEQALVDYDAALSQDEMPFVYIHCLPSDDDYQAVAALLERILATQAVVVMRGIDRSKAMKRLWLDARQHTPKGQTYSNGKTAIIYATPRFQREDFSLWL